MSRVAATTRPVPSPDVSSLGVRALAGGAVARPAVVGPAGRIKHVVVFYQENHSFDETLGRFCQVHKGRCNGYTGPVRLASGTVVKMKQSPDVVPNVFHSVLAQVGAIDGGKMDGWAHVGECG